jgi:hypothetical protein
MTGFKLQSPTMDAGMTDADRAKPAGKIEMILL